MMAVTALSSTTSETLAASVRPIGLSSSMKIWMPSPLWLSITESGMSAPPSKPTNRPGSTSPVSASPSATASAPLASSTRMAVASAHEPSLRGTVRSRNVRVHATTLAPRRSS